MSGPPHRATVRDTRAMLAGMDPILDEADYIFCSTGDGAIATAAGARALSTFHEAEGLSLILQRGDAEAHHFDVSLPMRRIVLTVNSALDGVGLTAAVSSALAAEGIACNVVAAFRHDHIFIPADRAERALAVLRELQAEAAKSL